MSQEKREDPLSVSESGITEEERAEIRQVIDRIATENRIPADSDAFSLRQARRGLWFPLGVNAVAIAAILAIILLASSLFDAGERTIEQERIVYASVEGRLIRELREESQQLLIAKEQEIETVRAQLQQLETEMFALEADIEERLAQREEELRRELEREIREERARLIAEGLDSQEIERLMEQFEAERRAYYEQQLEEFRQELEAERAALQADIDRLRAEYSRRLSELEAEREEIITEYEAREATLRRQLEDRTRVIENLQTAAVGDLRSAREELSRLTREEERVDTVENQIVGQMARIQEAVAAGETAVALGRIESLREFLQEDSVAGIEALSDRRAADLFLLDRLESQLEEEQQASAEAQEGSILQELQAISRIRRLSAAREAGSADAEDAGESLEAIVAAIPEVEAAHNELVTRAVDSVRTGIRDTARAQVGSATNLVAQENYEDALRSYERALEETVADPDTTQTMIADLISMGYSLTEVITGDREAGAEAQAIAGRGGIDLETEREAFREEIAADFAARRAELEAELEALRGDMDEEMAAAIAEQDAALSQELERTEARIAELESQIAAGEQQLQEELEAREAALARERIAELEALAEEAGASRDNLVSRIRELRRFEEQVQAARSSYEEYLAAEEAARAANPDDPITASRQELNDFLQDEDVRALFGDLSARVNTLFAATQTAGSSAALADAAEIVATVADQPDLEASRNFLAFEIQDLEEQEDDNSQELLSILQGVEDVLDAAAAQAP